MTQKNIPITQQIEILTKMSDGKDHLRHEFQSEKKINLNDETTNEVKGFPHSTLHKRWNELLEEGSILEIHSGKLTKRGDEKVCGQITFFGFVKLLSLSKQNLGNIDKIIEEFLPPMKDLMPQIIKKFSKKTISDIFKTVCKNIKISYHKKITESLMIPLNAELLMKQWVSIYELKIKVKIYSLHIIFSKFIYLSGDDRKKQTMEKELVHATKKMQEIFIGYFIYELLMRYVRFDKTSHYENDPEDVTCIFQDDSILWKLQNDFVNKIKLEISLERKALLEYASNLSQTDDVANI